MPESKVSRMILLVATLEIIGLGLGIASVVHFHRLTMLLFFTLGLGSILAGIGLFLGVVVYSLVHRGVL